MQIIDTHIHLYDFGKGGSGQPGMSPVGYGKALYHGEERRIAPPSFRDCASSSELLLEYMDWCHVEKGIILSNPYYGYFNEYIAEVVKKYPGRLKGVALVDVLKGRAAADELEKIYQDKVLFGMAFETKNTFFEQPCTRLSDPLIEPVWQCMAAWKQPAFLHMFTEEDVEDVEILSERYPDISFVLCHIGADAAWGVSSKPYTILRIYEMISKRKNVFVDVSSIPDYGKERYPFPTAVRRIQNTWKAIGGEKMLWGSDYPGMLTQATYHQLIDMVLEECRAIPYKDKEWIMGENAERLFFREHEAGY